MTSFVCWIKQRWLLIFILIGTIINIILTLLKVDSTIIVVVDSIYFLIQWGIAKFAWNRTCKDEILQEACNLLKANPEFKGCDQMPNQGYDPMPNQGYDPMPNQGYDPMPNQGYDPMQNQGYDPMQNQGYV